MRAPKKLHPSPPKIRPESGATCTRKSHRKLHGDGGGKCPRHTLVFGFIAATSKGVASQFEGTRQLHISSPDFSPNRHSYGQAVHIPDNASHFPRPIHEPPIPPGLSGRRFLCSSRIFQ